MFHGSWGNGCKNNIYIYIVYMHVYIYIYTICIHLCVFFSTTICSLPTKKIQEQEQQQEQEEEQEPEWEGRSLQKGARFQIPS